MAAGRAVGEAGTQSTLSCLRAITQHQHSGLPGLLAYQMFARCASKSSDHCYQTRRRTMSCCARSTALSDNHGLILAAMSHVVDLRRVLLRGRSWRQ